MAYDCPECGALLTKDGCGVCGFARADRLATMFATMTRDLEDSMDRRLTVMKDEILKAINGARNDKAAD